MIFLSFLFKVVNPEIFNDDIIVVLFENTLKSDTFNHDTNEKSLFNVVRPITKNDEINVLLLFIPVNHHHLMMLIRMYPNLHLKQLSRGL